ncbi:hypothetical protein M5E06_31490 [Azospirillum sp. A1-3]|uniref:hypothetical protein n=1 Tax=Azospirillum sp. A1-3 TaxID=185874 RepID=UPI002076E9E1|nr:hypothetical protein [Azospirillum sp. A1-3]MCM8738638.1 hypothetical protein [Azospirillum sp. A1-3]
MMTESQVNLVLKEDLSSLELSIGRPGEPVLAKADFTAAELEKLVAALIACVGQMKGGKTPIASGGTMDVPPPFVNPVWRSGYDVSGNAVLCFQLVRGCWVAFQLPQHEVANLAQALRKFLNIGHSSSPKSH